MGYMVESEPRPLNTRLDFLYRDAANYKTTSTVVVKGSPTPDLTARLHAALDEGTYFAPELVGLEHPARRDVVFMARFPDPDDDHPFVELDADGITATARPATDTRTLSELVAAFEAAHAAGWNTATLAAYQPTVGV